MYDVHNNLAPDNIKNMFTKLSSVHSYRTRSVTNENYYVEQVRTENMKRAFSISGALIWNSISLSIKTLKGKLFEILEKENDCIRLYFWYYSAILKIITWCTSVLSTVCLPVSFQL